MEIVTIDGYAGVGKTTIAKRIAKHLNFKYLDTGAMYRAFSLYFIKNKIDLNNIPNHRPFHDKIKIIFKDDRIFLNDEDVSDQIRLPEIDIASSIASAFLETREFLVDIQKKIGENGNIVAEGRDMGTVVFPHAKYKFFLTANPYVRAKRRYEQNLQKNIPCDFLEIFEKIITRDEQDSKRLHSPIKVPEDAFILDTSSLSIQEVEEIILSKICEKRIS